MKTNDNWSFADSFTWGNNEEKCNSPNQSPINIDQQLVQKCDSLCNFKLYYKPSKCFVNYKNNLIRLKYSSGSYLEYNEKCFMIKKYHDTGFKINKFQPEDFILTCIRNKLTNAVKKRLLSDRPIGALLSGGLDSSLVCGIICKLYREKGIKIPLKTFSIGIKGSTDLYHAQTVANYIGSEHYTIECTEEGKKTENNPN